MIEKREGGVTRLIRFLALGVPTVSRILALALIAAAVAIAFFDIGDYPDDDARATVAALLALLALVSVGVGFLVPKLVERFLPSR